MSAFNISFSVQADQLDLVTDEYLHALWYIAQANPAPHGDAEAGSLVFAITDEIVKRWLAQAPTERFNHQVGDHMAETLRRHGSWSAAMGEWLPHGSHQSDPIAGACTPAATPQTTHIHTEV